MTNTQQNLNHTRQDRFGLKVAARLEESSAELPYDISERLRAARAQALARRKAERTVAAPVVASASGGSAVLGFGDEGIPWFQRIASVIPLVALVGGLIAISAVQGENRAREVAEIDTALLTDDLPPAAYADPGFAQFLKQGGE
ncbi:MAG: DUF3619 family protein [Burkholderiaceae bacterium]